jgi:glycosyltransferase involved in cell wall biosynthesis
VKQKNSKVRVGIFIPCFNEIECISSVVDLINDFRVRNRNIGYEFVLLVVDDGSTDGSYELLSTLRIDALYRNPCNKGLGSATRQGMEIAHYLNCDVFVKFDADMQHDVNDIIPAISPIIAGESDISYGSRFSGSINYKMPLIRHVGNKVFTFAMRKITKWEITDAQTGLMCFGRNYLNVFEMPSVYNPPQQALLDAKNKGMRFSEAPVQFHARQSGESFVSLRYIPKVLSSIAKLMFLFNSFRAFAYLSLIGFAVGFLIVVNNFIDSRNRGGIYLENSTAVLFIFLSSAFSLLLGLFSFAVLSRQNVFRNNNNYFYISLENIELISRSKYRL